MVKMEWSCDLCHVIAPSEQALNEHVYGKEHMAREEELLIASKRDESNKIEAAQLINPNNVKEEWSCALCQVRTTSEQNLNKHLQGKKHKAKEEELLIASKPDESNKIEAAQLINPNNVKEEWSCALCQVRTTSEQNLNKHLQGKKHKAKEEELLIASTPDESNKIEAAQLINPNNVKEEWSCALCQVRTTSEQNLNKHLQGKKHKAKEEALLIASKPDESNKIEAAQLINPNNVKEEWSCALCQVRTTSEQNLNKHLQGKKHKAKEEALLIASKPASFSTISKKADNSNTLEKQGVTSNEQEKKLEQQVPKEAKEIVSKQPLIHYCEHCKLQCNSESMLASHLSGKKLLSCMQKLKALLAKVNEEIRADLVAKTMEENIKSSGNNKKGPALNKDDKFNKLVNEVMTTSSTKELQKLQVGQSLQQVPKKQSKAVKKLPVRCELCNVECYGEHILESHLRGKKHLARMKELGSDHKGVSVNHTGDANAGVTYGSNEETETDVNKVVEIIEVKRSIGSHQDEQVVASETMDGVPVPSTEEVANRMEVTDYMIKPYLAA